MSIQGIRESIEQASQELGFSHFGWSPLQRPLSFEFYESWLQEGLHGDMKYLAEHAPTKAEPQIRWPRAQSALVFAIPYFPHPEPAATQKLSSARVSLYAQGMDYHFWFKERMTKLCSQLSEQFPGEEFLAFTDSSPILERDLARRAGLGWVGKNTCVIHPKKGSLFFIGEIYTSLQLTTDFEPLPDFCGTCTRCIDICPTGALLEPRKMDARKCISYLTIESRQLPEENLREAIGDWFFGCDLCQTVCPWNQKVFKGQLSIEKKTVLSEDQRTSLIKDMRYILTASGKQLSRDFLGTPLARAGSFGLKRNALIVSANQNLHELKVEIESLLEHEKLGELASWALSKI
ncbi:tRNA epoxyqueuosine(34) reductase QueG [Bdellovibrio sp. HCB2-146]|uniref:tRNA epoxyqueuosine(34) reductase QueG n=1 Tax=Bdellovibrio sp. HCB2-146 TaxID=3394362 RepID=UPI0039BC7B01